MTNLPPGWAVALVRDVGRVQLGRQRAPAHHNGSNMRPYLRPANVFEDRIDTSDVMAMNFTDDEYRRYSLQPGDILLNEGQSRELVGRPAIYRGEVPGACFQNTLVRFQYSSAVLPEYALGLFRHYLRNGRFQSIAQWTTNIAHLGAERFSSLQFPLPPIAEQRRIVAKIESLFARSRRTKEALTDIVDLEAKLVAAYTERFPATPLGNHIEAVDEIAGERWRTFHAVGLSNEGVITERKEAIAAKSAPRCRVLHPGDIVFNPIRFSIGAIARYYGVGPAIVSPEYCVFRTKPTLSSELLRRFLRTPLGRSRLEIESQGSVRYRVYLANLAQLEIPTAPPARQAEAERFFTAINKVRAMADEATRDLKELESAILAKAFRGELVPQDSHDEPASALLERLRASHQAGDGEPKRKRRSPGE